MPASKLPKKILLILLLIASLQLGSRSSREQTAKKAPDAYAWLRVPVKVTAEPTDSVRQALLAARGAWFDQLGSPTPLDKPSGMSYGMSAGGEVQEEFPTTKADAVVTATFASYVPHLTPSKRSVYTEIKMHCDSVAFVKAGPIKAGDPFTVLMLGGTLVLPGSDRAISYGIERSAYAVSPGNQYLLFLRYNPAGSFYEIYKFWLIQDQKLVPSSVFDKRRAEQNISTHAGQPMDKALGEAKSTIQR